MSTPDEQRAPWPSESLPLELPRPAATGRAAKKRRSPTPIPSTTRYRRRQDRSSGGDDDAAARRAAKDEARRQRFPQLCYVRFADLRAWGIVENYTQLNNLIDTTGFPEGILIGKNTRAFPLHLVEAFLRSRPTARRATPHREKAAAAEAEAEMES
jgi:hypothetical protein